MATNVVWLNVYQFNQNAPISLGNVTKLGFGVSGNLIRSIPDTLALLSTGVYCYSAIQTPSGAQYYVVENQSQLSTLFNA